MSQVYRNISFAPGTVKFGNVANSDITVDFTQTRASIGDKYNRVPVLRTTLVLRTPEAVDLTPDCLTDCNKAIATRVVEIRTSSPKSSKAAILADLEEAVRILKLSETSLGLYDGFLPPLTATFTQV